MTTGVLVMAYGTPTTPDDVEAYYTRIRHGRAPTPEQLADLQRRYNAIGGTSPLTQRSADQVAGIAAALERPLARRLRRSLRLEVRTAAPRDDRRGVSRRRFRRRSSVWSSRRTRRRCRPTSTCRAPRRRSATMSTSSRSARGGSSRVSSRSSPTRVNDALATHSRRTPCDDRGDLLRPLAAREDPRHPATRTPNSCARAPNALPRWPASSVGTSRGSRPDARRTRGSVPTSCRSCATSARRR